MVRTYNATALRAWFALLMPGASVGLCACGGTVSETTDAVTDSSSGEAASVDACHVALPSETGCTDYSVDIEGDPLTCTDCLGLCGRDIGCTIDTDAALVRCWPGCPDVRPVDGRRPPELSAAPEAHDYGSHFARMAFFESASVDAFAILRAELRHHGAPPSILRSLARAEADERVHAELAASVARAHGGSTEVPVVPRSTRPRSLGAIALENAREGCGRELLGAFLAAHQAQHAAEPLRPFYAVIARDEARHAALSLRIHRWLLPRLSARSRARVIRAARVALLVEGSDTGDRYLGMPTAAARRRMGQALLPWVS